MLDTEGIASPRGGGGVPNKLGLFASKPDELLMNSMTAGALSGGRVGITSAVSRTGQSQKFVGEGRCCFAVQAAAAEVDCFDEAPRLRRTNQLLKPP